MAWRLVWEGQASIRPTIHEMIVVSTYLLVGRIEDLRLARRT